MSEPAGDGAGPVVWARSLLFAALLYGGSTAWALALTPTLLTSRRGAARGLRLWARWAVWLLRVVCGVRTEVRGREHLPAGKALVAAKHQGMFDTVAPFAVLDDPAFVLKRELLRIPFYGWYALKAGHIAVDREAQAKAVRRLTADARARLAEDRQVVIFPEGTRAAPGAAPDYKPGVAALYRELGLPCTPLATNSGLFWPAHGFLRRPGVVVFEFLPAIPPGLKRAEFMRTLQDRLEAASEALLAEGRAELARRGLAVPGAALPSR